MGVQVLTWDSPTYPALLKAIPNPPPVLYVRGDLLPQDAWALGVVGTRQASVYGREATRTLVQGLAASGVTIVSGLAYGIDTCGASRCARRRRTHAGGAGQRRGCHLPAGESQAGRGNYPQRRAGQRISAGHQAGRRATSHRATASSAG